MVGVGTSESGQGFKLPHIGLDVRFEATKDRYKVNMGCRVRQYCLQAKGDYHYANNPKAFSMSNTFQNHRREELTQPGSAEHPSLSPLSLPRAVPGSLY